jgi:arginyl-tRNA synthetase
MPPPAAQLAHTPRKPPMKDTVAALLGEALQKVIERRGAETPPAIQVERSRDPPTATSPATSPWPTPSAWACRPAALAEALCAPCRPTAPSRARKSPARASSTSFLSRDSQGEVLREVLRRGDRFGHNDSGAGRKVQVEFVSANPTGPCTSGTARRGGRRQPGAHPRSQRLGGHPGVLLQRRRRADQQPRPLRAGPLPRPGTPRTSAWPEDGYRGEYIVEVAEAYLRGARWSNPATSPSRPPTRMTSRRSATSPSPGCAGSRTWTCRALASPSTCFFSSPPCTNRGEVEATVGATDRERQHL